MSVTSSTELFLNRPGHDDAERTTITRTFRVLTDARTDTSSTVFTEAPSAAPAPLPVIGSLLAPGSPLVAATRDANVEGDDGQIWIVKVGYVPLDSITIGLPDPVKPWERPPVVSYDFVSGQEVLEKAYAVGFVVPPAFPPGAVRGVRNVKMTNSALQPFDPPLIRNKFFQQILITLNLEDAGFDVEAQVRAFNDTVNLNPITVGKINLAAAQGYCRKVGAMPAFFAGTQKYWKLSIDVVVNEDTWVRKALDQGRFIFNPAAGAPPPPSSPAAYLPVEDDLGNPVTDPILLDGAGARLNAGAVAVYVFARDIFELPWDPVIFPPDN